MRGASLTRCFSRARVAVSPPPVLAPYDESVPLPHAHCPEGRAVTAQPLTFDRASLRTLDTNTLLRLYDRAREASPAATQVQRDRADQLLRRVAAELRGRGVSA
jgi:hypothetical protein